MKKNKNLLLVLLVLVGIGLAWYWLKNDKHITIRPSKKEQRVKVRSKMKYQVGDTVIFNLKVTSTYHVDSTHIVVNGKHQKSFPGSSMRLAWYSDNIGLGMSDILLRFFFSDGETVSLKRNFIFYSDIEPRKFEYSIVNQYPHNRNSFTQGLQFIDGKLFESAGQYRESALREIEITSGETLREYKLSDDIFAEGMTIVGGEIYQLTWENGKVFVYDSETFELDRTYNYPKKMEGWGLTYDGKYLIMSEGSHLLYFLNPIDFSIQRVVKVFDNNGQVVKLNELEYVNGKVWANIYMTNEVVMISPETGKVEATVDFTGLLASSEIDQRTNVLNGIAYNKTKDTYFFTGKYWPKLYEVKLFFE